MSALEVSLAMAMSFFRCEHWHMYQRVGMALAERSFNVRGI